MSDPRHDLYLGHLMGPAPGGSPAGTAATAVIPAADSALVRATARQRFDNEVRAFRDRYPKLTRQEAIGHVHRADPELWALAYGAEPVVNEFTKTDGEQLARGWNAAVAAELPRCGNDPVRARSAAARKHPGLREAFIRATQHQLRK